MYPAHLYTWAPLIFFPFYSHLINVTDVIAFFSLAHMPNMFKLLQSSHNTTYCQLSIDIRFFPDILISPVLLFTFHMSYMLYSVVEHTLDSLKTAQSLEPEDLLSLTVRPLDVLNAVGVASTDIQRNGTVWQTTPSIYLTTPTS